MAKFVKQQTEVCFPFGSLEFAATFVRQCHMVRFKKILGPAITNFSSAWSLCVFMCSTHTVRVVSDNHLTTAASGASPTPMPEDTMCECLRHLRLCQNGII